MIVILLFQRSVCLHENPIFALQFKKEFLQFVQLFVPRSFPIPRLFLDLSHMLIILWVWRRFAWYLIALLALAHGRRRLLRRLLRRRCDDSR
jgi:hypothetical protein